MSERVINRCFVLTGGNLGNRAQNLHSAKELIATRCGVLTAQSAVYETAAWGLIQQPPFLNQALAIETWLEPEALLQQLLEIELLLGRQRFEKYGPRTIDIDILFYNDSIIETNSLTIPHPQLHLRRFALTALCDIAPLYSHPTKKKTITALLDECTDNLDVHKF